MRRSEPLDLDPAAKIEPLCHFNLVRSLQIRRLRCVWEQVGDGTRRRSDPAAARGSGLPDFTVFGRPGFDMARFWVREVVRDTVNSTGLSGKMIRVWPGLATARCGTGSPVNCVYAVPA